MRHREGRKKNVLVLALSLGREMLKQAGCFCGSEEGEAVLAEEMRGVGRGVGLVCRGGGPRVPVSCLGATLLFTCTLLPLRCILRIMLPWVVTSVQ